MIMKINGGGFIPKPQGPQKQRKTDSRLANLSEDDSHISSDLQQINKAASDVARIVETERQEKVASLQADIESGNYEPNGEAITQALDHFVQY